MIDGDSSGRIESSRRRRFLRGLGATGLAGVAAGCVGDGDPADDENGTSDENGDDGSADDGEGDDPAPAFFEVSDPSASDVTRGELVTVEATIENTGEQPGMQDAVLTFDGDEGESTEVTLSDGESEDVSFDVETVDLAADEYDYEVATEDDQAGGTVTVDPIEPDDPLLSFGDVPTFNSGSNSIEATLTNPYPVALEDGQVTVDVDEFDGWEVADASGASFETLDTDASQDAEWELSVPEGAGGEYELTFDVSYTAAGEEADVSATLSVTVLEFKSTADPVHHWPMDEGEGDTVADAVGEEDGTLDGAAWAEPEWSADAAVESDGSGTVQLTDLESFTEHLNGNFAVAFTIESEDTSSESGILSARDGNPSGPGWAIVYSNDWFGVSQGVGMTLHDGSGDGEESTIVTAENGILDGGPHRVVINKITNDSESWEIYIDGQEVESEVPLWNDDFPANNFDGLEGLPTNVRLFDHDLDGDRGLEGTLDDVKLFDAPLAESAVVEEYEQQPWADEVPSENLISNPGFEEGDLEADDPDDWNTANWGDGAEWEITDEVAYDGEYSARISSDVGGDAAWFQDSIPVEPGTEYEFTAMVKTEDVDGYGAYVEVWGIETEPVVDGTTEEWVEVSVTITPDDDEIPVYALLGDGSELSTGTVWFDALTLEEA